MTKDKDEMLTKWAANFTGEDIPVIQGRIYEMIGGGMLADFAIRQPADFYIDARVGKLPYAKRHIMTAVEIYRRVVIAAGLNPYNVFKAGCLSFILNEFQY